MEIRSKKMQNQTNLIKSEGINFVTDAEGNRIAVQIDLERYSDILEEFFDVVISRQRLAEDDKISLADFKKELEHQKD